MKSVFKTVNFLFIVLTVLLFGSTVFSGERLKVFILAGQSNMQGLGVVELDGKLGTLLYMYENDVDGTFMHVRDENGWTVRNDVWVDFLDTGRVNGPLTTGFGAKSDLNSFGPEYQFGHVMGDYFDAPVLLIKCAWGGKSLAFDFRPPSSGWATPPLAHGDEGYYYQQTIDRVNAFKASPQAFYPAYNPADGYEIVGFGWHQGWNDRVNTDFAAEYEQNMKNFIEDIRNDLGLPGLPFVIANSGFGGWDENNTNALILMNAQLAMADYSKYPQFEGNVAVHETRDYWRIAEVSPGPNQGYHWHKNAESYLLIGEGMGRDMIGLLDPNIPSVNAGTSKITWSGEPVTFTATVDLPAGSDWTDPTYAWTVDAPDGVTVTVDPPAADNLTPQVTVTKPADGSEAIVTLTLSVNNAGRTGAPVQDTVRVFVSDDQCKAAIAKGLWPDHPTDFDGNCRTDLSDFAVMALKWLHSEELTQPFSK